jgi:hypothetical protein
MLPCTYQGERTVFIFMYIYWKVLFYEGGTSQRVICGMTI